MASTHTSFLAYKKYRWFKLTLILLCICIGGYVYFEYPDGHNGGTPLGYTLGTIGALLILFFTWLGIRKRRYTAWWLGSVQGWTSAHVWLGLGLIVIASLHTGFQFGWNLHTLAYVLMCLVVFSGLVGLWAYNRYPAKITALRDGKGVAQMLSEIEELNDQSLKLADKIDSETQQMVVRSIKRMQIGGSAFAQLRGIKESKNLDDADEKKLKKKQKEISDKLKSKMLSTGQFSMTKAGMTTAFMVDQVLHSQEDKNNQYRQLIDLISRRKAAVKELNSDITLRARMQLWLYFHVPLTFALLATLATHIVSVFLYW